MIPGKRTIFVFIPVILWMTGCGKENRSATDYMTLKDIRYVNEFPKRFVLDSPIEVETDIIGIQSLFIYDSLLVLSTTDREGLCSFLSLPDLRIMGKFLTLGNGPYEFFQSPWADRMKFFKEGETRYAGIYNFIKGELYRMNIDESVKNRKLSIYKLDNSLPKSLFNFAMIDSAYYFCKEIGEKDIRLTRYFLESGKRIIPPHLESLNLASISEGEDFNILATITKANSERKLIVEASASMNYINLYSFDGSFGKTICMGNRPDNIARIQAMPRWSRKFTFAHLSLYSHFWGVVYWNIDALTYETGMKKSSVVMLFDYEGEPLAEIKFNTFITSFDIDFANETLYTVDYLTDTLHRYNIPDILKAVTHSVPGNDGF